MSSFFSRVAHYTPTDGKTPKEDMLTQAFCAVLEAVPELAVSLAKCWWSRPRRSGLVGSAPPVGTLAPDRFRARPQRRTGGLWRVDLELRFGPLGYPDGLIWIENKVDSDLSGLNQLDKYEGQLWHQPAEERLLVFLTRIGGAEAAADQIPEETLCVDWNEVGGHLSDWQQARHAEADDYESRIVDEFIDHLEEEGLSVIRQPMQLRDVGALQDCGHAFDTLKVLLDGALTAIVSPNAHDGLRLTGRDGRRPSLGQRLEFWETYDSAPDFGESAYLEWQVAPREHYNNSLMVGAGLTIWPGCGLWDEEGWLESLSEEGFEPFLEPGTQEIKRAWRWIPLAALVGHDHIDGQVEHLSKFVLDAFDSLVDSDPPMNSTPKSTKP